MNNITAVILAAGLGTRMKSDIPKVLHPIGSDTILGKVVAALNKAGSAEITIVIGHRAELVEEMFKTKARFVKQPQLLGSGDALARALGSFEQDKGTILVTCGDTPLITADTYRKLVEKHVKDKASCTVLTCMMDEPFSYGRIVRGAKDEVLKIVEEKDASAEEKAVREINVGTYCFEAADVRKYIREIKMNEKKKEFYLTDIVDIFNANGRTVLAQTCDWTESVGINSRKDLAMANKLANRKKIDELMDSGVTVIDPDSTYIDSGAEIGKDTVIFPCTYIEADVKVGSGCKIGPFARLRPGTRVHDKAEIGNFVELCRTEVGEGTKVKHHTYLGDAVVGKKANIGAGTITANYDGVKKSRTVIEDEAFIGVGAVIIAPVRIGKGAVIGAGSVVTKNKDVRPGETVVGVPAKPFKGKK